MKAHIDEPVKVGDILRVVRVVPSQDGYRYVILDFANGYEVAALRARNSEIIRAHDHFQEVTKKLLLEKDAKIAELEKTAAFDHEMIQREIETGAFLINGHLATIDRQAAYIKKLEEAFLHMKGLQIWDEIDREQLREHEKDVDLPWMHAKEKAEKVEAGAREALKELKKKS